MLWNLRLITLRIIQKDYLVISMGYYSNLANDRECHPYDTSYTSPEQQLLWRLDDLYDRLDELPFIKRRDYDGATFSLDDYRYAPVECFETYLDVQAAILIVVYDLQNKYGIVVSEDSPASLSAETSIEQLTLFDYITLSCGIGLQQAA